MRCGGLRPEGRGAINAGFDGPIGKTKEALVDYSCFPHRGAVRRRARRGLGAAVKQAIIIPVEGHQPAVIVGGASQRSR